MAILYDARNNEIRSGFPDSVTNETVSDARPITAVLNAINAEVIMDLNGAATVTFDVRTAAAVLTFVFEGTVDGVNYFSLPAWGATAIFGATTQNELYFVGVTVATTLSSLFTVGATGLRRIRLRVSAFTSGSITVAARGSAADLIIYAKPLPSREHITVTAAANNGATITLPSGGTGLYIYITNIHISRNATAALAGTATLVITSTNLPGNPAWSVGNAMIAGGSQLDLNYSPTTPLRSTAPGTAVTIVMPVPGAAVLWRGNCSYYYGT